MPKSVVGITGKVALTPTLDTSQYASGDVLFTDSKLEDAGRAVGKATTLQSVAISDLAKQKKALDLLFFNAEPATGTYTAKGAFDLDDADALLFVGHVHIASTDYVDAADSAVGTKVNSGLQMTPSVADLYVIGVIRDTPTYAASDLKITFEFIQD